MRETDAKRPVLVGYMVLDGYAEDYSDWDGVITGPANPSGANLYWHDPIPMIEKRAYGQAVKERDFASQQWRDWNAKADALYRWGMDAHDMLHEWASRTPVESWPAGIRGLIEAFPGCDCIPYEKQCGFHAGKTRLTEEAKETGKHYHGECGHCMGHATHTEEDSK